MVYSFRLTFTCARGGMVDALDSGSSGGNSVEVRVLSCVPVSKKRCDLSKSQRFLCFIYH